MRALMIVLLVLAVPRPAAADAATQAAMAEYFAGEQRGAFVLGAMGTTGLVAGGLLYADGGDLARGASYPLLGLGLAHVGAGIFVYVSSRSRVRKFGAEIAADAAGFRTRESRRMQGVSRQFLALKITWVVLIAGGLTTGVIARDRGSDQLAGAGFALAGEAAATLVFDIFAARRAHRYRAELAPAVQVGTAGEPVGLVELRAWW